MHEATRRLLGVLLRQLDGYGPRSRSIVIGATNRRQDLDPALLSRFDAAISFGWPDEACRRAPAQAPLPPVQRLRRVLSCLPKESCSRKVAACLAQVRVPSSLHQSEQPLSMLRACWGRSSLWTSLTSCEGAPHTADQCCTGNLCLQQS